MNTVIMLAALGVGCPRAIYQRPTYYPPVWAQPAAAVQPAAQAPAKEKPLYERLGGEPAIKAVVDDFVARAAANPKVNFTRKGTTVEWEASAENAAVLKKHL